MERIVLTVIAMLSGLSCELIVLPQIDYNSQSTLLSNIRVGGKYGESALDLFTRINKGIKYLNAEYQNITAEVEKGEQDPEKLIEKAFIDLKNTLSQGSTELNDETSVLKFGSDFHEKVKKYVEILLTTSVDKKLMITAAVMSYDLEEISLTYRCHLKYDPTTCPKEA